MFNDHILLTFDHRSILVSCQTLVSTIRPLAEAAPVRDRLGRRLTLSEVHTGIGETCRILPAKMGRRCNEVQASF